MQTGWRGEGDKASLVEGDQLLNTTHPLFSTAKHSWLSYRRRLGQPTPQLTKALPGFLVVSPARTGTTWLAKNLAAHPDIFVPPEKELRYFDAGWVKHDLQSYITHFLQSAAEVRGEATPNYALLPRFVIGAIREVCPAIKVIFLFRDPVSRAWSHLRHNFSHREAGFAHVDETEFDRLDVRSLARASMHGLVLASGDYAEMLLRWTDYFPKDQIHVGFFEHAVAQPEFYLRNLFAFLGVSTDVSVDRFLLTEAVNRGEITHPPIDLMVRLLSSLFADRDKAFRNILREHSFGSAPWPALDLENDIEERPVWIKDYLDYRIWLFKGKFLAFPEMLDTFESNAKPILEAASRARKLLEGDYVEDLQITIRRSHGIADTLDRLPVQDARLCALLDETMASAEARGPELLETYRGFNILRCWGRVCAAQQSVGSLPITSPLAVDRLVRIASGRDFFIAQSVLAARREIDRILA